MVFGIVTDVNPLGRQKVPFLFVGEYFSMSPFESIIHFHFIQPQLDEIGTDKSGKDYHVILSLELEQLFYVLIWKDLVYHRGASVSDTVYLFQHTCWNSNFFPLFRNTGRAPIPTNGYCCSREDTKAVNKETQQFNNGNWIFHPRACQGSSCEDPNDRR